eukprot:TRINITY_DN180_c0_g1_i1.p1 TRINITY_DN180_c0_g1~~TRINITY_DN180_c0_g1_i1.p1  ORF type:complete len:202 (-),score=-18.88 TRINITY_DN180_c0_g1_i1:48-653(-)
MQYFKSDPVVFIFKQNQQVQQYCLRNGNSIERYKRQLQTNTKQYNMNYPHYQNHPKNHIDINQIFITTVNHNFQIFKQMSQLGYSKFICCKQYSGHQHFLFVQKLMSNINILLRFFFVTFFRTLVKHSLLVSKTINIVCLQGKYIYMQSRTVAMHRNSQKILTQYFLIVYYANKFSTSYIVCWYQQHVDILVKLGQAIQCL